VRCPILAISGLSAEKAMNTSESESAQPRARPGAIVRLPIRVPEDIALPGGEQHPRHGQISRWVAGSEVAEVDHGADTSGIDQDVGRVEVAMHPGRRTRPGFRCDGGLPDGAGGAGVRPAHYEAEVLGDPLGPFRERAAAERVNGCVGRRGDVQRREEFAERDGSRGQISLVRQGGDLARQEWHHAPFPREGAGWPAGPDRRRDRQRKPGGDYRQPALLMRHQLGGLRAPGQPHEEVRADGADHVVPPVRQHPDSKASEIGVLLGQKPPDELNGDIDLWLWHALDWHHTTIRRPADTAACHAKDHGL